MPSLRARLTNLMLRATSKRLWRPGLDIDDLRRHTSKVDARMGRRAANVPVEEVTLEAVPAQWIGTKEAAQNGTLLYLHGGAWCLHLPNVYRKFAGTLSLAT